MLGHTEFGIFSNSRRTVCAKGESYAKDSVIFSQLSIDFWPSLERFVLLLKTSQIWIFLKTKFDNRSFLQFKGGSALNSLEIA